MSWATNRTNLNTVLVTNEGYTELKSLIQDDEPNIHKFFYMQPVGIDLEAYSDDGIAGTDEVELKLYYINRDTTKRDANYQLFLDLIKAISAVASFNGYTENGTFEDLDSQNTIGTLRFFIGVEVC